MNKIKYLAGLFLVFGSLSCLKKIPDPVDKTDFTNLDVNNWIYTKMKEYYLWSTDLPAQSQTNVGLDPDKYFESILVQPGEVDRFSWIQESSEELKNSLNGLSSVYGFKYAPFYADASRNRIGFAISYCLEQSAAERAGIKRGDFITKVNGTDITIDNYTKVLEPKTATFTLGKYENGEILHTNKTVEVTKEVTQADALQFYNVVELEGKKIGYFVYTQFLTSNDKDLNNMFKEFKTAGINELVVDFRYNPGGYISSAEVLSSLIVKGLKENMLMSRQVWNNTQTEKYKKQYGDNTFDTYFFKSKSGLGELNNVGDQINRVYFLVSTGTASASELVINNLKPFMEVKLIGSHTYGKNVGSITIEDDTEPARWAWGMQPIVLKSVNSLGQSDYGTKNGFLPDIAVADNLLPFRDFGDPDETLLHAALTEILGSQAMSKLKANARIKPSKKFDLLLNESLSDNPINNRKDMWVKEFPFEK